MTSILTITKSVDNLALATFSGGRHGQNGLSLSIKSQGSTSDEVNLTTHTWLQTMRVALGESMHTKGTSQSNRRRTTEKGKLGRLEQNTAPGDIRHPERETRKRRLNQIEYKIKVGEGSYHIFNSEFNTELLSEWYHITERHSDGLSLISVTCSLTTIIFHIMHNWDFRNRLELLFLFHKIFSKNAWPVMIHESCETLPRNHLWDRF